jgi:DNA-directed RNA polymerase subunit F
MEPKIIEQKPISITELKIEIENIKKREKEPSIRITKIDDYLNSFVQLSAAKEKELTEAIQKLNVPRLREDHIVKITELVPRTVDDLKMILQGYVISVSNDNLKKIVDTVNSTVEKK